MNQFPHLLDWFRFADSSEINPGNPVIDSQGRYDYNECRFFSLIWKEGVNKDRFCREFAKLIVRLRIANTSQQNSWQESFANFIDSGATSWDLNSSEKSHFHTVVLRNGMQNDQGVRFDDGVKGYIGEVLYFLVLHNFPAFERIISSPDKPKKRSTDPGNDVVELCLSNTGEIFVVFSEIKTTGGGIGTLHNKIVNQLNTRIGPNYSDNIMEFEGLLITKNNFLLSNYSGEIAEKVKHFLYEEIDKICILGVINHPKKHMLGMINYGINRIHTKSIFKNISSKIDPSFHQDKTSRNIILVGVKDMEDIINTIYNLLFNS